MITIKVLIWVVDLFYNCTTMTILDNINYICWTLGLIVQSWKFNSKWNGAFQCFCHRDYSYNVILVWNAHKYYCDCLWWTYLPSRSSLTCVFDGSMRIAVGTDANKRISRARIGKDSVFNLHYTCGCTSTKIDVF